jgi:hypothetical protein
VRRTVAGLRAIIAALFVFTVAVDAAAQSVARPRPPGAIPLEEAPPPPQLADDPEPAIQPQVTTRVEGGRTIQEYRIRGKLYMQKVTPAHGHAYVLMDHKGDGTFTRQDNTLDNGVRVPQWVLLEF